MQRFFKSIIDEDKAPVVICNTEHEIVYMNPAACSRYEKYGGSNLLGKSLMKCHNPQSREMIEKVIEWFKISTDNNRMFTYHNDKENCDVYMIALRHEEQLIGYYEKHEYRNRETEKLYNFG